MQRWACTRGRRLPFIPIQFSLFEYRDAGPTQSVKSAFVRMVVAQRNVTLAWSGRTEQSLQYHFFLINFTEFTLSD